MRARSLAGLLVLACVVGGCSSKDDQEAGASAAGTSTGSTGSADKQPSDGASAKSGSTSGEAPGTSPGSAAGTDKIDPMVDDKGAPGAPDAKGRQTVVFDRLPGNTSGACETVGSRRDVKSGGFVGGAFDDARRSYGKVRPGMGRKQVRLYWVPQHTEPMGGVTVVATSGGKRVRVTEDNIGDAEQWKFYDTVITLPAGGSWRFRVSSGVDRGCFVASF